MFEVVKVKGEERTTKYAKGAKREAKLWIETEGRLTEGKDLRD